MHNFLEPVSYQQFILNFKPNWFITLKHTAYIKEQYVDSRRHQQDIVTSNLMKLKQPPADST